MFNRLKRKFAKEQPEEPTPEQLWRARNEHNHTTLGDVVHPELIEVGNWTYGAINLNTGNLQGKLRIGHFCSIAPGVVFVMNNEHDYRNMSTYPFKVMMLQSEEMEAESKGGIVVADDVWIGYGATILDGVHIGQGAVIGARAVVTKDVPPYAIVAGNPAKIIRMRFSDEMISRLLTIDFGVLDIDDVKKNMDRFYEAPTPSSVAEFLKSCKQSSSDGLMDDRLHTQIGE